MKGIEEILYHFKAWFRSLGLSVYNVKLYREEETKYVYVGSQFFFRYKTAKFYKNSWDEDKGITATITKETVFLF